MKTLIAYYSRTKTTEKVAQKLAKELGADIEKIEDLKDRKGPIGFARSGKEAMTEKIIDIKQPKKDPDDYDLIIIGTPVWAENISSPARAYLEMYKDTLKNKKICFFCTTGGSKKDTVFKNMQKISKEPKATLLLTSKDLRTGAAEEKIEEFTVMNRKSSVCF